MTEKNIPTFVILNMGFFFTVLRLQIKAEGNYFNLSRQMCNNGRDSQYFVQINNIWQNVTTRTNLSNIDCHLSF